MFPGAFSCFSEILIEEFLELHPKINNNQSIFWYNQFFKTYNIDINYLKTKRIKISIAIKLLADKEWAKNENS